MYVCTWETYRLLLHRLVGSHICMQYLQPTAYSLYRRKGPRQSHRRYLLRTAFHLFWPGTVPTCVVDLKHDVSQCLSPPLLCIQTWSPTTGLAAISMKSLTILRYYASGSSTGAVTRRRRGGKKSLYRTLVHFHSSFCHLVDGGGFQPTLTSNGELIGRHGILRRVFIKIKCMYCILSTKLTEFKRLFQELIDEIEEFYTSRPFFWKPTPRYVHITPPTGYRTYLLYVLRIYLPNCGR